MQVYSTTFPGRPECVAEVRHWLESMLSPTDHPAIPDDARAAAVLLLSELATNALRHALTSATGGYGIRVALAPGSIRVEVEDGGPRDDPHHPPRPRDAGPDDESGRGLVLVAAFADEWGRLHPRHGMYFRLRWPAPPAPAPRDRAALRPRRPAHGPLRM
ncbi:ATP-binding protein [Streptomonospora sp. S1-112]|uniref:ATP-binding protein n=1 Tax=Streptomonospora mangrovi TaxID=2883123 RepID=A0A9X3SIA0_9ACTN|nr:ATP-binding protein [Streptomonospora mangrovi]MDA0566039.1 ATP-binding protein [Streptomonospora mangrovi]